MYVMHQLHYEMHQILFLEPQPILFFYQQLSTQLHKLPFPTSKQSHTFVKCVTQSPQSF